MAEKQKPDANFNYIVRVANTDLDGSRPITVALKKIKGVGFSMSNVICKKLNLNPQQKAGELSDDIVSKLNEVVAKIDTHVPDYMLNRRKDPETGKTSHIVSTDLLVKRDTELREMKKLKSYKGIRHIHGLPVRGQRTKSNFRRNKGKSLGVKKAKSGKKG